MLVCIRGYEQCRTTTNDQAASQAVGISVRFIRINLISCSRIEACKEELAKLFQEVRVTQSSQDLLRPFPCPFLSAVLLLSIPGFKSELVDGVWAWGEANACSPLREHFQRHDLEGAMSLVMTQTGFSFSHLRTFKEGPEK